MTPTSPLVGAAPEAAITAAGTAAPSLRARKKEMTAASIEAAALRLFAARGFGTTSVEDIAAAAVVSPKTVRRYFGSKEDILFFRPRRQFETTETLLWECPADEPIIEALVHAVRRLADGVERDRAAYELRRDLVAGVPTVAAAYLHLLSTIGEEMSGFVGARLRTDDADGVARLVAGAVVVALQVAIDMWVEGRVPDLPDAAAENVRTLAGPILGSAAGTRDRGARR